MSVLEAARGPQAALTALVVDRSSRDATLLTTLRRRTFSLLWFETSRGRVVVKLSRSEAADRLLRAEYETISALPVWSDVDVPRPCGITEVGGRVATAMAAVSGVKLLLASSAAGRMRALATAACDRLNGNVQDAAIDAGEIRRAILAAAGADATVTGEPAVDALIASAVRAHERAGRRRVTEWTHNDCTAANVLIDGDRIGIIDWALAAPRGFASIDRLMLEWHCLVKREGVPPLAAVRRLCRGADADIRAAAIAMCAIYGARGHAEGQPARLELARQMIDLIETT